MLIYRESSTLLRIFGGRGGKLGEQIYIGGAQKHCVHSFVKNVNQ